MSNPNQKSIESIKDDVREQLLTLRPGQYREILSALDMVKAEITFMAQNRLGSFRNTPVNHVPVKKFKWIEPLQ